MVGQLPLCLLNAEPRFHFNLQEHLMSSSQTFKALVVNKTDSGLSVEIKQLSDADLPADDVRIAVEYSTVNYKDGLAVTSPSL